MAREHRGGDILDIRGFHLLAVVISKLDEDGFCAPFRSGATQGADGSICLPPGVVEDKPHPLRHPCIEVHQHPGLDDLPIGVKQFVQLHLRPGNGQVANIQVGALDVFTAHACLRHLDPLVLQLEAIQGLDRSVSIRRVLVVYKAKPIAVACSLVADDLGRLDGANAKEHGAVLLIRQGLREVVDDEVGGRLLAHALHTLVVHVELLWRVCREYGGCVPLRWSSLPDPWQVVKKKNKTKKLSKKIKPGKEKQSRIRAIVHHHTNGYLESQCLGPP